jgi:hypothetical protein
MRSPPVGDSRSVQPLPRRRIYAAVRSCPKERAPTAFRVTIHDGASEFRLVVEGPITSKGARDLEQCWRTAASSLRGRRFTVDFDRGASTDEEARGVIERLHTEGAILNARARLVSGPASFGGIVACLLYRLRTWMGVSRAAPGT